MRFQSLDITIYFISVPNDHTVAAVPYWKAAILKINIEKPNIEKLNIEKLNIEKPNIEKLNIAPTIALVSRAISAL